MNTLQVLVVGNCREQIKEFVIELEKNTFFPVYYDWITGKKYLPDLASKFHLIIILDTFIPINIKYFNTNIALHNMESKNEEYSQCKYFHYSNTIEQINILISKIYIVGGLIEYIKPKPELHVEIPKNNEYYITEEELMQMSTPIYNTPSGRKSISPAL